MFGDRFIPNVGLSYASYKLSDAVEKEKDLILSLGANYKLNKSFSFDIQGQYLRNKFYKSDFRFFIKLNYWLFTNIGFIK